MKGIDAYYQTQLNRHQAAIDAADLIELHNEDNMTHTEHDYIQAGYRYERASNPDAGRAHAEKIRAMLSDEHPADKPECLRLIEQGRQEARR